MILAAIGLSLAGSIAPAYGAARVASHRSSRPQVLRIWPARGRNSGGYRVHIIGRNFAARDTVRFGRRRAYRIRVRSATLITALAPRGTGSVHVSVHTTHGTSGLSVHNLFSFDTVLAPRVPSRARLVGPTSTGSLQPVGSIPGPWVLRFDDEFNGNALDTGKWTPYWFNDGSTQNGTVMQSSNVSVSGGDLRLALNRSSGGLVSTNGKFQFTYGYAEARIYLPPANGGQVANWPAFWTDGQNWPTDGEADVMEGLGGQACYHFHDPSGGPGGCPSGSYSGWHTFGVDWEPGRVTYYYDGVDVGSITSGITSAPMYLILENSLGGGPYSLPSTMLVDYVRVWQH